MCAFCTLLVWNWSNVVSFTMCFLVSFWSNLVTSLEMCNMLVELYVILLAYLNNTICELTELVILLKSSCRKRWPLCETVSILVYYCKNRVYLRSRYSVRVERGHIYREKWTLIFKEVTFGKIQVSVSLRYLTSSLLSALGSFQKWLLYKTGPLFYYVHFGHKSVQIGQHLLSFFFISEIVSK